MDTVLAGMAKVLGSVTLKLGSKEIFKVRANTTVQDLLQQLEKAYSNGRIVDREGYDVTQHYSQDLPGGEYQVMTSAAGKLMAGCYIICCFCRASAAQQATHTHYGKLQTK